MYTYMCTYFIHIYLHLHLQLYLYLYAYPYPRDCRMWKSYPQERNGNAISCGSEGERSGNWEHYLRNMK